MSAPPQKFLVRRPEGLSLLVGPPVDEEPVAVLDSISCAAAVFSEDGSRLAVNTSDDIRIFDTSSVVEVLRLPVSSVVAFVFSPRGSYLQTFQRSAGQQDNTFLWHLKTGLSVSQHLQKDISKSSWPAFQFSEDESVACRLVKNEVHIFDARDFSKGVVNKLRVPGLLSYKLGFSPPSHIAVYVPESKGAPASVRVFKVSEASQDPVGRRSFYKSTSAQLLWNEGSTGVLIVAQTEVDKSNKSYYGESRLHYITSDGSYEGIVPLKEGPIHDVQWSPSGKEFVAIYGFMPASVTLFDANCKPLFQFGAGPYNIVRWSIQSQFICLAGFGNLPGDMAFWDRSTLKTIGNAKAACSVTCDWSPDGRHFMTATTAPRLQVDNGIKIFKYNGALEFQKKFDRLYQAEWQPASRALYADRPAPPSKCERPTETVVTKVPKEAVVSTTRNGGKPATYRPPHVSNANSVKAQLFGEDTAVTSKGHGELSKSALKNKKRREKQKQTSD